MSAVDIAYLIALGIPATAVAGYPITMAIRAFWLRKKIIQPPMAADLPPVTLVISAHNEEVSIVDRLENALSLEYPAGKLRILVLNDGSSDRTSELVRRYADRGVVLRETGVNRGKSAALSEAVPTLDTEIAIFTDANSRFDREALVRLVRWFANPRVGAVCGRLVYDQQQATSVDREEDRYWRWDNWIKNAESTTGDMVAGNGSILAIRTHLAEPIPAWLANDFAWLNIARLRGFKVCFDPTAVAFEKAAPNIAGEFNRRVRIMTRGLNAVAHAFHYYGALAPKERAPLGEAVFFFAQLIAKKLFRYLAFPALLVAMALTPFLTPVLLLAVGWAIWGLFVLAIVAGLLQPTMARVLPRWPNTLYPLAMASASLVALGHFVRGRRISTWRTHRQVAAPNRPAVLPMGSIGRPV